MSNDFDTTSPVSAIVTLLETIGFATPVNEGYRNLSMQQELQTQCCRGEQVHISGTARFPRYVQDEAH